MTAIILAKQPKHGRVHLVSDAAQYLEDQSVAAFGKKVNTIPHWPGAVTTAGNGAIGSLFACELSQRFSTWDDLASANQRSTESLATIVYAYGLAHATVILAGYSAARDRPEAFMFQTGDSLPAASTLEEVEASPFYDKPYRLIELPDHVATPTPPDDDLVAANFEGILVDEDPDVCIWSMRKALAMARHMPLPDGIGGIGGFAELTTISADGITQRVIDRWPEDKVGAPLRHGPCDWETWHANNPKPGMSRLKREMAARKASKLRVVK